MSLDRTKEELQWLRTLFPVAAATAAALVAYSVQATTTHGMMAMAGGTAALAVVGMAAIARRVYQLLHRL